MVAKSIAKKLLLIHKPTDYYGSDLATGQSKPNAGAFCRSTTHVC